MSDQGPLRDVVHSRLVEMIARGQLGPNEPLREARLAELLGTSRAPIREAILMLEEEGWVTRHPRRGARVHVPTKADIDEVFGLRRLLEAEAVRLAIPHASMYEIGQLRKAIVREAAAAAAGDVTETLKASRDFHGGIARLTRNELLVQFLASLQHRVQWLIAPTVLVRVESDCLLEHEEILQGMEDRDPDRAVAAVYKHIEATRRSLRDHWQERAGTTSNDALAAVNGVEQAAALSMATGAYPTDRRP